METESAKRATRPSKLGLRPIMVWCRLWLSSLETAEKLSVIGEELRMEQELPHFMHHRHPLLHQVRLLLVPLKRRRNRLPHLWRPLQPRLQPAQRPLQSKLKSCVVTNGLSRISLERPFALTTPMKSTSASASNSSIAISARLRWWASAKTSQCSHARALQSRQTRLSPRLRHSSAKLSIFAQLTSSPWLQLRDVIKYTSIWLMQLWIAKLARVARAPLLCTSPKRVSQTTNSLMKRTIKPRPYLRSSLPLFRARNSSLRATWRRTDWLTDT